MNQWGYQNVFCEGRRFSSQELDDRSATGTMADHVPWPAKRPFAVARHGFDHLRVHRKIGNAAASSFGEPVAGEINHDDSDSGSQQVGHEVSKAERRMREISMDQIDCGLWLSRYHHLDRDT